MTIQAQNAGRSMKHRFKSLKGNIQLTADEEAVFSLFAQFFALGGGHEIGIVNILLKSG